MGAWRLASAKPRQLQRQEWMGQILRESVCSCQLAHRDGIATVVGSGQQNNPDVCDMPLGQAPNRVPDAPSTSLPHCRAVAVITWLPSAAEQRVSQPSMSPCISQKHSGCLCSLSPTAPQKGPCPLPAPSATAQRLHSPPGSLGTLLPPEGQFATITGFISEIVFPRLKRLNFNCWVLRGGEGRWQN